MNTIREIVSLHTSHHGWGEREDLIVAALEQREQEKVDALSQVALAHGVMPPVLAKVLVDLELGAPRSDEEKALVNQQFEVFKADMIRRYSETTGIPEDLLRFPDTTPPTLNEDDLPGGGS